MRVLVNLETVNAMFVESDQQLTGPDRLQEPCGVSSLVLIASRSPVTSAHWP